MNLLDVIQKAVRDVLHSSQLTDMVTGVVESTDPLTIVNDISQAPLREEVLILTETVKDPALETGDKVIMLSVMHGQKYLVISRS